MLPLSFQPSLIGLKSLRLRLQFFQEEEEGGRVTWRDRLYLRKRLVKELQESAPSSGGERLKVPPPSFLLQPGSNLKNPFAAVSVSHCPSLAGFALSFDGDVCLGLDLELAARLKKPTLERVSSEEEMQAAPPLPALLWTAKEAAFKCASSADKSLMLLRDIFVAKWRKMDEKRPEKKQKPPLQRPLAPGAPLPAWLFRFQVREREKGEEENKENKESGGRRPPEERKRKGELLEGLGFAFLLKRHAAAIATLAFKSESDKVKGLE